MSLRRSTIVAGVALTLASVASSAFAQQPAASPTPQSSATATAFDPVGSYTLNLTAQGTPVTLTARVERTTSGALTGELGGEVLATPLPFNSVTVDKNTIKLVMTAGEVEAVITMTVASDGKVTGEWSQGGDGSELTGQKNP